MVPSHPDTVLELATDAVLRPARTGNAFEDGLERLLQAVKLGDFRHGDRLPHSRDRITGSSFNCTPLAVLAVLGFAGIWWLVSAKNWFTGPKVQGTEQELEAAERDLETLGGAASA